MITVANPSESAKIDVMTSKRRFFALLGGIFAILATILAGGEAIARDCFIGAPVSPLPSPI